MKVNGSTNAIKMKKHSIYSYMKAHIDLDSLGNGSLLHELFINFVQQKRQLWQRLRGSPLYSTPLPNKFDHITQCFMHAR